MEKVNEEPSIRDITKEIVELKQEVLQLKKVIEELSKNIKSMNASTSRMDSHIDFVEGTYETLRRPLNYIANRVNGTMSIGYLSNTENKNN
jgi:predicted nuclease with TOPRIM domain